MAAKNLVSITVKGITVKVSKDMMNDIDIVEWFGELQEGNVFVFPKLCKRMFGDEQYLKVKDALKKKSGVTTATDMSEFLMEAMTALNALEAKN